MKKYWEEEGSEGNLGSPQNIIKKKRRSKW